jgi:hypothetical protein
LNELAVHLRKDLVDHILEHLPSGQVSEEIREIFSRASERKRKFKFDERDLKCAEWMWKLTQVVHPAMPRPNLESWANDIRLMRVQDNKTYADISRVFAWANKDTFWRKNIASPDKLRKQFWQLEERMNEGGEAMANHQSTGRMREDE